MPTTWADSLMRISRGVAGHFPYPHQAAFLLDNPLRRAIGGPGPVIDAIGLSGTERVLEVGPGPGFYSPDIAKRLTTGHLALFDLQPEMLDKARRKLERAGFTDVDYHAGQADGGLPYPDTSFDVAFLAAVIGEVPDQRECVRSLARVLKPGGLLVFHEAFPDPDRISVPDLRALAEPEGFAFVSGTGNRWYDTVLFRRNRNAPGARG